MYIGMTNDLNRRLSEHQEAAQTSKKNFAGKYAAYFLIYWERFDYVEHAIEREKELKGWRRSKKEQLIKSFNQDWKFLNNEI
jgi:putative endonuclease